MADEQVVKQLVDRLSTEDLTGQELAAEQIRQVCKAISLTCHGIHAGHKVDRMSMLQRSGARQ